MDGCSSHAVDYVSENNRETAYHLCKPHKVVTDNGPTSTSYEFQEFMQKNGIVHVKSAPYHPLSNGLVERVVQTLKRGIARISGTTLQERVSKFLFKYRLTPHSQEQHHPSSFLVDASDAD